MRRVGVIASCPGTGGGVLVRLLPSLSGGTIVGMATSLPLVIIIVISFGRHRVVMELGNKEAQDVRR